MTEVETPAADIATEVPVIEEVGSEEVKETIQSSYVSIYMGVVGTFVFYCEGV